MATRLTPLGIVLKWIVVPISLGAIGYFLVGPRVESEVPKELKERVKEFAGKAENSGSQNAPEAEGEETKPTRTFEEPEVDVTVTALNTRPTKPKRKRKRRSRPRVETPSQTQPVSEPSAPSDPGGTGEPPPVSDGA